jgi:BCD family chlorophyll transporter-like MFS transporter
MVWATVLVGGFFWAFAILGIEGRMHTVEDMHVETISHQTGFSTTLGKIWRDRRTRAFFFFLSLATLSAWMQDAILEPFGADVFNMSAGRTTRFNSYWQVATVIFLSGSMFIWRKRPPERQGKIASSGLLVMAVGLLLLGLVTLAGKANLTEVSLLIYGAGFGLYTFGGLSLMAVMSSDREAGAYLGLWTVSILVFRGLGTFLGGALRDLFVLNIGLPADIGYGLIFILSAVGLVGSVLLLTRVDILGFARDAGRVIGRVDVQTAVAD